MGGRTSLSSNKPLLPQTGGGHICSMNSGLVIPSLGHSLLLHGQSQVVVTPGSRKEGQRAEA